MADIFDRKQEVLDVVLTRKGRELIAKNKRQNARIESDRIKLATEHPCRARNDG
jgi:hypothetical protein